MENSYRFLCNRECEYFPCHKGLDPDSFNCLFCFCPLYTLGSECGGNFRLTADGTKDCSDCTLPHSPSGYDYILSRWDDISGLARGR